MRDELTPNQSISMVLLDEASRDKFGEAPYQRRIFATLIKGLTKLKAAVIGIDFRFEEASDKLDDSLLVDAIRKSENVVIGCYFRNIDPASGSAVCYETEEMPPVWSPLMAAGASAGHLGVFLNQYNRQISFMPGFISAKDSLIPCFPLQIVKTFHNIEDNNIEIRDDEIKLLIANNRSLEVPTNFSSEILINFLGDEEVFTNCYSFIDVHAYCKTILADTGHQELSKEFENKIVLIGSLIDEDIFVTPYSYNFPGVLIHATVIDNILSQRFLKHVPCAEFFILPLLAFMLYLIFLQPAYFRKIAGAAIVLLLFIAASILLFTQFGLIIRTSTPILFILLTAVSLGIFDYISALQRNLALNGQVQHMDRLIKSLRMNGDLSEGQKPFFRLIILYIEERDRCIFPNWLEMKDPQVKQVLPFQTRLSAKNPLHVNLNTIRKLKHDLEIVWQNYYEYVNTGKLSDTSPLELLKKIGAGVRNQFGLKQTYDTLFRFENSITPLNLVLGSVNVPWQFAYYAAVDQFLCEKYAIGITFVSEKEFKERSTIHNDKTDSRSAILYYGDWQGNPGKELRNAGESISHVQKILNKTDCEAEIIYENVDRFLSRLATESENNSNVRIIHYLGHAEEDYLDVGKNDYLKPGVIIETIGVSFSSRPLVFLNACSSGKLPSEWKINDHLCTEFLAAGAGACIVTNFDVYDKTADAFQKYFYELYVEQNMSSGEALKQTILAMGEKNFQQNYRPDYDISRYAYCLFGDPTIKF